MRNLFIGTMIFMCCLSFAGRSFAYEKEIKALSITMCEKVAKAGKKTLAVADFTDLQGNTTELGRFLAEELSSNLAEDGKGFEIVDRNNLRSILTEHKFSMSGLVDPKTIKELGRIAGVDAIVTGTITPFGDSVRVSAKVIATDTAKVIATAKGDIAKTKAIEELLCKGIDTGASPVEPQVASPTPKPVAKGQQQQVEVKNFLFQLQKCTLSGQTVTCDFLVTNKDNDRQLTICSNCFLYGRSRIVDDMGNEFNASKVQMGNSSGSEISNKLVSNIPMKSRLSFEGVTSQPKLLSLLEINCGGLMAQLRDIPLATK